MKHFATILSLLFVIETLNAQQTVFQNYSRQDGLVSNNVRRIFQDSRGFIWIGTWEGLSRFDGYKFTNFTTSNGLSGNMINDFYEADDGALWVAENNEAVDVIKPDGEIKKGFIKQLTINQFLKTRNGRTLAITDNNGIYEVRGNGLIKPAQQLSNKSLGSIIQLNDTLFAAVGQDSPFSFFLFNEHFDILDSIRKSKNIITKVFLDSKNRFWAGSTNGLKLVRLSLQSHPQLEFGQLPVIFDKPLLRSDNIEDFLGDKDGNTWIATSEDLVKVLPSNELKTYTVKNGLPSSEATCLFQDNEKNIWIGTSLGVAIIRNRICLDIYTKRNGLVSDYLGPLKPVSANELLVFGLWGCQLFNYRTNKFSKNIFEKKFSRWAVNNGSKIFAPLSPFTFAQYDSINKLSLTNLSFALPDEPMTSIVDSSGAIFLAFSGDSLSVIYNGKVLHSKTSFRHRIHSLIIDNEHFLWAGIRDGGLYRIQFKLSEDSIYFNSIRNYSSLIANNFIRSMFKDSKGNIWLGTRYGGAYKLAVRSNGEIEVKHFEKTDGLCSNWIGSFAEDKWGNIWISSPAGLDKLLVNGDQFSIIDFNSFSNYFGWISDIQIANDNSIWCTSKNGLIHFHDPLLERLSLPNLYITSATLGTGKEVINGLSANKTVQLNHNEGQAQFEFGCPDFTNEKGIRYSYRLDGSVDTSWSIPSRDHNVLYASLKSGEYRFEVKALGWNGEWGTSVSYPFVVLKPFWQQWWFIAVCILLLASVLYLLYRYRLQQLMRLQKVRNRIATDLHDEIGSSLTNINILSKLSKQHVSQPQQENFLQRISEEVDLSSQALDDIIWSVNSGNDNLKETVARMRRYAAELFDADNVDYKFEMDPSITEKKIQMELRRDFYLIYKEAVNNICKHASASHVFIKITNEKNNLGLIIVDDGKGFDSSATTHRNGLKNLYTRTERWKGDMTIESQKGKGTSIKATLPFD